MPPATLSRLLATAAALALPSTASADPVQEVLDCVAANLPQKTIQQRVEFRSEDRVGGGRTILSRMKWRRFGDGKSRALIRVEEPADLKDSGVLVVQKNGGGDMFVYLPDLRKVRRITSRMLGGKLFGSDFTYEDFMQLQGMHGDGQSQKLEDSTVDGVAVHVIEYRPAAAAGSSYEKVTTYVTVDTCVPLKSEMYETGGKLRKVMTTDPGAIFEEDGVRIPQKVTMKDLRDQSQTSLVIEDVKVGGKLSKGDFTTSALERPGRD